MPRRLVTVSYTALDAGGGVPKFNRDLQSAFPDRECRHFCWDDFPWATAPDLTGLSEWDRARTLNAYLVGSKSVTTDDVVVADGFWAKGLEHLPLAVSHSHGIWSHLTHEDVQLGKAPDMPGHHTAQVLFRRRWTQLGKHITAVSEFIAKQMRLQWGFEVDRVINNGVDTDVYRPRERVCSYLRRPMVIHGVNDRGNVNKGWEHIELLQRALPDVDVLSLDEAYERFQFYSDQPWTKPEVLAQATLVVHPSGFEGNSMFVAESLACGVPVVAYDVGALSDYDLCGLIMDRSERSPQRTLECVRWMLGREDHRIAAALCAREFAVEQLSIDRFNSQWRSYIEEVERDA
jgi:glycosyltransferase involved in cell wall biosynthesis